MVQKHRLRLGPATLPKNFCHHFSWLTTLHYRCCITSRCSFSEFRGSKINYVFSCISLFIGELFLALVTSKRAHANIIKIDPSAALEVPGVHGFIDHTDIQGQNLWGTVFQDEELLASKEVSTVFV